MGADSSEACGFGAAVLQEWNRVHVPDGPFRALWDGWLYAPVAGIHSFVVQHNPEHWARKRGGRHVPEYSPVRKPFDREAFNFTKLPDKEVLLRCSLDRSGGAPSVQWTPGADPAGGEHMVAINVSPMFRGHSLLVVRPAACLQQLVTREGSELAVAAASAARSGEPSYRVGYNSLGAFASVNHLHFHLIAAAPTCPGGCFPVEHGPFERVANLGGAELQRSTQWPARTVAISGPEEAAVALRLYQLCDLLQQREVPFNFIIRGRPSGRPRPPSGDGPQGVTAYVCPRRNQSHNAGQYRAAVVELGGVFTMVESDLSKASEADIAQEITADVTLDEEQFGELLAACAERMRSTD